MKELAVLLTCFNRKEKTLNALKQIEAAKTPVDNRLNVNIYLTDDGSTDGTSEAVKSHFPNVRILQGDGNLFWAGGMRKSWGEAIKSDYDGYLLLNDDTDVFEDLFEEFLNADAYCSKKYDHGGIYIGSTQDPKTKKLTYGGARLTNRFTFKYQHLVPNGKYQKCELGNANILFVAKDVTKKIGILSEGYRHGVADYDYTLKASKQGVPVLVMPKFLGTCTNDHSDIYEKFGQIRFKQRLELMKSPIGLDFWSNLNLMKRHFPIRVPFVVLSAMFKLFFPRLYTNLSKNR